MTSSLRPTLALFGSDEPERIVGQACRVLESVGVRVEEAEGGRLLLQAGATLHEGRTRIPEKVVRQALASAPSRVVLYNRKGDAACDLGADRVHFDPGSAALYLLDPETGRRREASTQDVIRLTRLVDRLPYYAAQATALLASDIPKELGDRYRLYLALLHGEKPVVTGTFRVDGFAPMKEMLACIRGG